MGYDIVVMEDCASCFGVFHIEGSHGEKYVVTFGGESYAHCTCKAFQFSRDHHCKHIDEVYRNACMYNSQYNDGNPNPKYRPVDYTYHAVVEGDKCPACGGPVVAVRRAV